jgi:hypothetical protein
MGAPTFIPDSNTLVFTCFSSEALEGELNPVQYTITICFDGVATCKCPDFERNGGACKHIRAALLLLEHLRSQGINLPHIPMPTSLTEAHALQFETAVNRAGTTATSEERPTVRAAAAVADLLREDETCTVAPVEAEEEIPAEGEDDDSDVDTDASSDSGDEGDIQALQVEDPSQRASTNLAALGEQALARTIYELQDVAPRLGDLAEFMKRKTGPLSTDDYDALAHGCGHLAALLAELDRLLFAVPVPTPVASQLTQIPPPSASRGAKRKGPSNLLPPSPEKASKRHTSYSAH